MLRGRPWGDNKMGPVTNGIETTTTPTKAKT